MFELLTSIPAYKPSTFYSITESQYTAMVDNFRGHFNRACQLFEAYWRTSNTTLFDMSLEALGKAWSYMDALTDEITDEKLQEKLRCRATFTYDMAAAMMGAKHG